MTERLELNRHTIQNLGLMKIRLVSASVFFCLREIHLSSPSLPTGSQAQDAVFMCNPNKFYPPSPFIGEIREFRTDGYVLKGDSGKKRKIPPGSRRL